jgi:hypothetical protein
MKKIIIGSLAGTVIFFVYQSVMWMGGLHGEFSSYTPKQDAIIQFLSQNLPQEGLYTIPMVDPGTQNRMEEEEKLMKSNIGKPWTMIFWHNSMKDVGAGYVLLGALYSLIACLIAVIILHLGKYSSFGLRFFISFLLGIFAISQGVLDNMNWWSFPWSFVRGEVIDLTLGWGITCIWFGWYLKNKTENKTA